jgi:hypothetical protein
MADLDKVPVKNSIQFETIKLDEEILNEIKQLNDRSNSIVITCGNLHLRKLELQLEMEKTEASLKLAEDEFKSTQIKLNTIGEDLDEKYPQARISIVDGTITYQPDAPSRKQQMMQQQGIAPSDVSVV